MERGAAIVGGGVAVGSGAEQEIDGGGVAARRRMVERRASGRVAHRHGRARVHEHSEQRGGATLDDGVHEGRESGLLLSMHGGVTSEQVEQGPWQDGVPSQKLDGGRVGGGRGHAGRVARRWVVGRV